MLEVGENAALFTCGLGMGESAIFAIYRFASSGNDTRESRDASRGSRAIADGVGNGERWDDEGCVGVRAGDGTACGGTMGALWVRGSDWGVTVTLEGWCW